MKPKPRRGGRPKTRKAKPGERVHLGLRVSPELKRQLERAAEQSTRSLSQEVEFRLEQSLDVHAKVMFEYAQAALSEAKEYRTQTFEALAEMAKKMLRSRESDK